MEQEQMQKEAKNQEIQKPLQGIFVAGTDTGVGKTMVCAGLLKMIHGSRNVHYWKPIQTGTIVGDDTKEIQSVTEFPQELFWEPSYRFAEPLAPEPAAKKWNKVVEVQQVVAQYEKQRLENDFVVVEGAGGVMVPLSQEYLQIDFMRFLGLPVLLVAEDRLGAINHTLLSIKALREAGLSVLGVILTKSSNDYGNKECIEHFGTVKVLAQIKSSEDVRRVMAEVSCDSGLRKLCNIPPIPV